MPNEKVEVLLIGKIICKMMRMIMRKIRYFHLSFRIRDFPLIADANISSPSMSITNPNFFLYVKNSEFRKFLPLMQLNLIHIAE